MVEKVEVDIVMGRKLANHYGSVTRQWAINGETSSKIYRHLVDIFLLTSENCYVLADQSKASWGRVADITGGAKLAAKYRHMVRISRETERLLSNFDNIEIFSADTWNRTEI